MKNINIQKIRTILKRMLMPQCSASEGLTLAKQVLTLLPCEKCGGTKEIKVGEVEGMDAFTPCPDCNETTKEFKELEKERDELKRQVEELLEERGMG